MTNESPTLRTYEELADVDFDLDDEDIDRTAINQALEEVYNP